MLSRELEAYFETSGCPYECWQDIARVLMRFVRDKGHVPCDVNEPQSTGLGTSMYVIPFWVLGGIEINWLVYDDEAGVYGYYTTEPKPETWT